MTVWFQSIITKLLIFQKLVKSCSLGCLEKAALPALARVERTATSAIPPRGAGWPTWPGTVGVPRLRDFTAKIRDSPRQNQGELLTPSRAFPSCSPKSSSSLPHAKPKSVSFPPWLLPDAPAGMHRSMWPSSGPLFLSLMRRFSNYEPRRAAHSSHALVLFAKIIQSIGKTFERSGPRHLPPCWAPTSCIYGQKHTLQPSAQSLHQNLWITGRCKKFQLALVTTNKAESNSLGDSAE